MQSNYLPHIRLSQVSLILLSCTILTSCASQPPTPVTATPTASPPISITKPINKAKDTSTDVQQKAKEREQLDPEKVPPSGQ
jgi:hypothetical protein